MKARITIVSLGPGDPDLLNEKFIAEWHGKESDLC